jgi:hypothetical protein
MKSLIFLSVLVIAFPVKAITWNEFWRPFRGGGYYYAPSYYSPRYYSNCRREVIREEVVSGDGRIEPYVRTFKEVQYYPC